MSSFIDNNINSAIISSQFGIQKAYQGMTQASLSIAQRAAQDSVALNGPQQVLANASLQSLSNIRDTLPKASGNFASDILSLRLNSMNALASAKVLDVAYDAVGTIIDTLA